MSTTTAPTSVHLDTTETEAFIAGVKAVAMSASTDAARPILTGICIEIKEQQMKLVATDSYRLTIVDLLPWPELHGKYETTFIINAKQLASSLPRGKNNVIRLTFNNRDLELSVIGGQTFTIPHIEGTYPSWRSLVKDKDTKPTEFHTIGLNPKLVTSLMKSADTFRGRTDIPVRVKPALTELKPIHMELTVPDVGYWYSLLMPVRIP